MRVVERLAFVFMAVGLLCVISVDGVPLHVGPFRGVVANIAAGAYAGALAFWAFFPKKFRHLHAHAAALGILIVVSRTGGFVDMVLDGRHHFITAIPERIFMGLAMLTLHYRAASRS